MFSTDVKTLEWELNKLKDGHRSFLKRDYKSFWDHVKEINLLFKDLNASREDREKLWNKLQNIIKECKEEQKSIQEDRHYKSKPYRDYLIREIESCRPIEGLIAGITHLATNTEEMKDMGRRLREADLYLSKYKEEMTYEHIGECFKRIKEVREVQNMWWEYHKKIYIQQVQVKKNDYIERIQTNLDKNRERYAHASEALRKMEYSADKLRDKISSAYTDNFRNTHSGWLSELENKISDTKNSLRKLEKWIEEDEEKLRRL